MIDREKLMTWSIGALLGALVFALSHSGLLDGLELRSIDFRFRVRGPTAPQAPIVLISIDQDSFDELRLPWPWPRTLHAQLVQKLTGYGVRAIGFDILFTEPKADGREDRALGAAIKRAGNVVLAAEYTEVASDFGPRASLNLPIPVIRDGALGYGPANLMRDKDSVVRRAQPAREFQERIYPSFAQQLSGAAGGDRGPNTASLAPVLINFRGPARTYPTIPYYRVLREEIAPSFFKGKIVLVGAFATSLHDVFPTPFSAQRLTAGVEIQANYLETLLAQDPIVSVADWLAVLLFIAVCILTIWLTTRFSPLIAFVLVFALMSSVALGALAYFVAWRTWLPITPSLVASLVCYVGLTLNSYIREQRLRLRTRAEFMKYVSPEVVEEILKNREGLALGGERRHITVLFSDVRGFTGISESIGPELVVSFLGDYFARVTQIIFKNGGTVDKFMGDGVMALFGAPTTHSDDATRAVRTGIEMIAMVEAQTPVWTKMLGKPITIGIGVNSGDAVIGRIGSALHSNYTAIGDTVNLASRLETLTKELAVPLLVSETTATEIADEITMAPLQHVKVVGRETALRVYTYANYVQTVAELAVDSAQPYVQQAK